MNSSGAPGDSGGINIMNSPGGNFADMEGMDFSMYFPYPIDLNVFGQMLFCGNSHGFELRFPMGDEPYAIFKLPRSIATEFKDKIIKRSEGNK